MHRRGDAVLLFVRRIVPILAGEQHHRNLAPLQSGGSISRRGMFDGAFGGIADECFADSTKLRRDLEPRRVFVSSSIRENDD